MKTWILACLTLLLVSPLGYAAGPPAVAQQCVACHGQTGISNNPEWPNLAGQNADYLVNQIKAFRDGERVNPAMAPFVKSLSDADIDALATYYAGQKPGRAANGNPDLVERGQHLSAYCMSCHGMTGRPVATTWPLLAGQHAPYLEKQLAAFASGERKNTHMQVVIRGLGAPEYAALAAYYSQLEP